jgi:hypothetical protein
MKLLYGADPELFVYERGRYKSAHDLIPGTKECPHPASYGAIQVDGVAAEFNIWPASNCDEFVRNILEVKNFLSREVQKRLPNADLVADPTARFTPEYFDSLPFETKLLGCTPDFDAYTGAENEPPATDKPIRTGGGHIHIGWTQDVDPFDHEHFALCRELTKRLDDQLYNASLDWDSDQTRRELYGKMGSFRPKSYGLEYRPLSNAWVADERLIERVFYLTDGTTRRFFNL